MKPIALPLLAVFVIFISGFFPVMDAAAEDKTCEFKAHMKKVHLIVWDEDSGGDRQGKTFEGWLKSGGRKKVQSDTGFIVFRAVTKAVPAQGAGGTAWRCTIPGRG